MGTKDGNKTTNRKDWTNKNWVKIPIKKQDLELAETCAAQQRAAGLRIGGTSKFQTSNAILDHKIGHLGQLIFKRFLDSTGITYKYFNDLGGHGDRCDFELTTVEGVKTVDIKTGHLTWPISMLKPGYRFFIADQQIAKAVDIYVNIQLDPQMQNAYIIGWINRDDIMKYGIMKSDSMCNYAVAIPLVELQDIRVLIRNKGDVEYNIILSGNTDNIYNNNIYNNDNLEFGGW